MQPTLDKKEPHEKPKTGKLTQVKGYVAPTDTGTIRTVRPHEKLVEVDVKEAGQKKQATPNDVKIKGAQTINEAVDKLHALNQTARDANFSGKTDQIVKQTVGFYRGGVNTSANPRLDEPDGLRKVFDEMKMSLHDIGFDNRYSLTTQQAIVKITSPEYARTLAGKASIVERRLNSLGIETKRLDPFTIGMNDAEGKNIYVSNNPLDLMTADKLEGRVNEANGNVLTAIHQDRMNDFVFYTANNLKGGTKNAAAVATYDPKSKRFFHYTDNLHPDISPTLKDTLKSKRTLREGDGDGKRNIGEIEQWEIRAMMTEKLQSMEQQVKEQVEGNVNEVARLLELGDAVVDRNALAIRQNNANTISQAMSQMNQNFEKQAEARAPKSLATGSPLHQKISQFKNAMDSVIAGVQGAIDEFKPKWEKLKSEVHKK